MGQSLKDMIAAAGFLLVSANLLPAFAGDGPTPLSRGELYSYIAGKTQITGDGGVYYADDGTLQVLRKGESYRGTWSTKKTGELCWHVYDLGELPCSTYLRVGAAVHLLRDDEVVPAPELKDGNALSRAKPELAASAKKRQPQLPERDLFTRQETIAFLSGKTSKREPNGRMYYAPDFTLKTIWNGVRQIGTWSVDGDGGVCWQVAGWGPTPCEYYFYKKDGGILWARFRGRETAAAGHIEGDHTGAF